MARSEERWQRRGDACNCMVVNLDVIFEEKAELVGVDVYLKAIKGEKKEVIEKEMRWLAFCCLFVKSLSPFALHARL